MRAWPTQETSTLSDYLKDRNIKADYYHAGQGIGERKSVQHSWQTGQISVVCATIAYGMGIDKPDVRSVPCRTVLCGIWSFVELVQYWRLFRGAVGQ